MGYQAIIYTVLIPGSSADCGDPSCPVNGDVMAHESTLEDSSIFFQCSPGFSPSVQMMSVCAANGSWTPDPAILTCMPPPPGKVNPAYPQLQTSLIL